MRTLIANSTKTLFAAAITIGLCAIATDSAVSQSDERVYSSRYKYVETKRKTTAEPAPRMRASQTRAYNSGFQRSLPVRQSRDQTAVEVRSVSAPRPQFESDQPRVRRLRPVKDMATLPREYRRAQQVEIAGGEFNQGQPNRNSQAAYTASTLTSMSANRKASQVVTPLQRIEAPKPESVPSEYVNPSQSQQAQEIPPRPEYETSQETYDSNQESYDQSYETYESAGQPDYTPESYVAPQQSNGYYNRDSNANPVFMDGYPGPEQQFPFRDQFSAFATPNYYQARHLRPYRFAPQGAIFGVDRSQCCDEWAGFCECKDLDHGCNCGGLKANPGHLGLKWLRSDDACDSCAQCNLRSRGGCGHKDCAKKRPCKSCIAKLRTQGTTSSPCVGTTGCGCSSCSK